MPAPAPADVAAPAATRPPPLALLSAVAVSGAVSMGLEMLGSRLLAPEFGQSLYTWGALISVVLVALAIGFSAGGLASRRHARLGTVGWLLLLGGAWILLLPWLSAPVTERLSPLGERAGALAAAAALFAVPVASLAAIGPCCIRMQVSDPRDAGLWAGLLSALNTAGSVAGTLGTSFFLIERWSVRGSLWSGGAATCALGLLLVVAGRGQTRNGSTARRPGG